MDGNGMDTEAGRIDVVSCGIGFPKDAETLGAAGRVPCRGPLDPDHRRESP